MNAQTAVHTIETNRIYCMDCVAGMQLMTDNSVDLTVTSPPYDNLRTYNGYTFDFEAVARELFRVTKPGGVVVWIVNDATVKGSETGTSFKQALFFKECGFNLHDTMIWDKKSSGSIGSLKRYEQTYEYMFVLSKGQPKSANIIKDKPNKWHGYTVQGSFRQANGELKDKSIRDGKKVAKFGRRTNVWELHPCKSNTERTGHPAQFPEQLAKDHIISWSNPGDVVLDIFMGSGTTAKMAKLTGRKYIGFEISEEYCRLAEARLRKAVENGDA